MPASPVALGLATAAIAATFAAVMLMGNLHYIEPVVGSTLGLCYMEQIVTGA